MKKTLTGNMELEDLVAYGTKGLLEAADRFDSAHGVAFSTFAYYRIRGGIYDGLRTMGWYSRADCARYRAEERSNEYLRTATEREAAERTAGGPASEDKGQILDQVADLLCGVATIHITSLDAAGKVEDTNAVDPGEVLDQFHQGHLVRAAIKTLPEKEQRLMELYYYGDKNLEEAGRELGLSKSWASRLHARAVDLLRDALGDQ